MRLLELAYNNLEIDPYIDGIGLLKIMASNNFRTLIFLEIVTFSTSLNFTYKVRLSVQLNSKINQKNGVQQF